MNWLKRQAIKSGEEKVKKELGNKSLAYLARVTRATIALWGVDETRRKVIKSIEDDFKRAKTAEKIDALIAEAMRTPEYMALLKDINLNGDHIQLLKQEALNGSKQ